MLMQLLSKYALTYVKLHFIIKQNKYKNNNAEKNMH